MAHVQSVSERFAVMQRTLHQRITSGELFLDSKIDLCSNSAMSGKLTSVNNCTRMPAMLQPLPS